MMDEDGTELPDGGGALERSFHDPAGGDSTGTAVAMAVGRAKDVPPTELPQLESTLDTDALDRLTASLAVRNDDGHNRISFRYAGTAVSISGTGEIVIQDADSV